MSLEDTLSNLTIYDAKKYFRKAQNVVFNYTDIEGKVREATNNEPWGASSTLMEQIAQGTYNLREREEILGMILRRFTEKGGSEWRQIYKALQLLDYLVRHGAERFIDDIRSSGTLSALKMLSTFHYIDSQGKDQGINVRRRAQELATLLGDDEQIRAGRRKARETANKFRGVAGGSAMGNNTISGMGAGFSGGRGGLSVSADFDSDSDEGFGSFSEGRPQQSTSTNNKSTNTAATTAIATTTTNTTDNNNNDEFGTFTSAVNQNTASTNIIGEESDDDDFADFQSAQPVASTNNLISSNATLTSPPVSNTTPLYSTSNNVMPAIASQQNQSSSDPFGSLFSTAKSRVEAEPPLFSNTNTTTSATGNTTNTTTNNNLVDDDDLFGDLTAATSTTPTVNASKATPPAPKSSANEEIDLLSF